ncbi:putative sodium/potassium/calcium exchanger 3 isoform X1 [Apostichopus japonicus]|uniref:Putative sodium/potassium/calcium exchanger 3 isoform X1 n=1 Tax=Stichopus japonicus TaxID=307972 RepID=A0A2G8LGC9_STIJA|nr:putative sodium/potassium/calcium exchanger 3 isoform X1 [Apostichopus japonicus]
MKHRRRRRSLLITIPCSLLLFGLVVTCSYISNRFSGNSTSDTFFLQDDPSENGTIINCTAYTPDAFPQGVFNESQLARGAFLINVVVAIYLFGVIAIVCDDYYVPSLEVICQIYLLFPTELRLSQDVAGATFMAAGSSAPELFTSVIGKN